MLTPSFNLTATERVLPRLALDFTTALLDSRVTFTRTTGASNPATYVANTGNITAATNNQPRFDHNPLTLVCKGLLIEESRVNLLLQSQDFSTTWTNVNSTESINVVNSPDGTQNAAKLEETSATGNHTLQQSLTIDLTSVNHTFSCFIKAAERTKGRISFFRTAGSFPQVRANFDLTAKTISASGLNGATYLAGSAFIQEYPNGWFRIGITGFTGQSGNHVFDLYTADASGNVSFAGTTGYGFYPWGAQLEAGAFATSYIPTTTAALTRNADVATMTGTNFSDWFNASEGALQINATAISASQFISAGSIYLDNNNYITFGFGDPNKPRLLVRNAGTFEVNTTASVAQTSPFNQCVAYKASSISFASNTTLIVNSVNKAIPSGLNTLRIGANPAIANSYANAWLTKLNYWPQRLINNEVIAFSK